ncbi:MAG: Nif3-like dinuclear metal center hexameric protein [Oscillospiraceae bacterium]|nr:Nif3-like dinuclear metal center hexameric protein [Oscillospiraceae bacterium]
MTTVDSILKSLETLAPPERKMDFDNVGLLVGRRGAPVGRVLAALDVTDDVITEAERLSADLIVTHHPVIFQPVKTITDGDPVGRHLLRLIRSDIAVISMHTNLDAADGGVNDALAEALGLKNISMLTVEGTDSAGREYCCGRIGETERPMPLNAFLAGVQKALNADGLRYCDGTGTVKRVAVVGGSGGSYLRHVLDAGCDTLVTADVKYDVFLTAKESGVNLIDADHFCTENTVIPVVAGFLKNHYPSVSVEISKAHGQTAKTWTGTGLIESYDFY